MTDLNDVIDDYYFKPIEPSPKDYKLPEDWVYRDIRWTTLENWEKVFYETLSSEDFHIVSVLKKPMGEETRVRGTCFLSPIAIEKLKAYIEKSS